MEELWKQITKVSEGRENDGNAWLSSNPFSNLNNRKFREGRLGTYRACHGFRLPKPEACHGFRLPKPDDCF